MGEDATKSHAPTARTLALHVPNRNTLHFRAVRLFLVLIFLLTACASNGGRHKLPFKFDDETGEIIPPPPGVWGAGAHPVGMGFVSGGDGQFRYKTKGTGNDRDEDVNAQLYRVAFINGGGLIAELVKSDGDMEGGTSADALDLFLLGDAPLWPNNRMRFQSRFGGFYSQVNLKKSDPLDVEPWIWGFRYELEGEVDIIKRKKFVISAFGNGRYALGWGKAKFAGEKQSVRSTPHGWGAGMRLHLARFMVSMTWIDRTMKIDDGVGFSSAEYGFEGISLDLGFRW